jgi:hypothetical protein
VIDKPKEKTVASKLRYDPSKEKLEYGACVYTLWFAYTLGTGGQGVRLYAQAKKKRPR